MSDAKLFHVEVVLVSPDGKRVVSTRHWASRSVTDELIDQVKRYVGSALNPASDGASLPRVELNATDNKTGDAMGQGVRSEMEAETFFQDSFFTD